MVFHKRSQRGGSKAAIKIGEERYNRNNRNMRKPNSYTQIDCVDNNPKPDESSLDDSEDSSQSINHLAPKLSNSDFASYLNEGND